MIGARLGSFEITAKLGEGGMGEVYRAHDSKLKRDVAIKVLPAAFTQDQERLARFEREAQLLAQLNHPTIAQVYGMETSGDSHALVMELVEGPTLADRLARGALLLNEAFSLAKQIAEALEEAHEKGIVHRDLKPQSKKASIEGKVKVLDFGLAKAMDPAAGSGSVANDGSDLRPVTEDPSVDWNPVWARDGRHLYLLDSRNEGDLWMASFGTDSGTALAPSSPSALEAPR